MVLKVTDRTFDSIVGRGQGFEVRGIYEACPPSKSARDPPDSLSATDKNASVSWFYYVLYLPTNRFLNEESYFVLAASKILCAIIISDIRSIYRGCNFVIAAS